MLVELGDGCMRVLIECLQAVILGVGDQGASMHLIHNDRQNPKLNSIAISVIVDVGVD